jgi:branched-chain amino acid transport system permease protein
MDFAFFLIQLLNGLQYGLLLFLVASGPDAGVRHHGHHQPGARQLLHGRRLPGLVAFQPDRQPDGGDPARHPAHRDPRHGLERLLFRHLYQRDHLYQVLLTYGLILVFEELRSLIWGDDVHGVAVPALLSASIPADRKPVLSGLSPGHFGRLPAAGGWRCIS